MLKLIISKLQLARDKIRRRLGILLFDSQKNAGNCHEINRILMIRWDAKWGDAIVSSFFLPEIRKKFPRVKVTVIAPEGMRDYFCQDLGADIFVTLPKRPKYHQLKKVAKSLGHQDLTIHLSPYLKMKDLYFFSKLNTNHIAGIDDDIKMISLKLGVSSQGKHFSAVYDQLLKRIGIESASNEYIIPRKNISKNKVSTLLKDCTTPIITINPYGSGSSRQLTPDSIHRLVSIINNKKTKCYICILITPDKKEEVDDISNQYENILYLSDTESIYDSIEIIYNTDYMISVDTATVHIATGFNKPTLALYNPDSVNFSRWHPNNSNATVFNADHNPVANINKLDWLALDGIIDRFLFKD